MEEQPAKTDQAARKARRSPKVMFGGVEIQRPVVPPTIPLSRIERAVKIAVQQYADELAARK
jgi:hypothetical protein